jgi:hypothetical protein
VATSTTWAVSWTGVTMREAAMSSEIIAVQYTRGPESDLAHIHLAVYSLFRI